MAQLRMHCYLTKPAPIKLHEDFEIVRITEDNIDLWLDAAVGLTKSRWTREEFINRMIGDPSVDYDHIYAAVEKSTGKAAATATAQIDENHENCKLHMVSSLEEYRGKGLGRAVCAAVLHQMYNEGVKEVMLQTDEFRIAAITLYLSLGFVPYFIDDTMEGRWDGVMKELGKTGYKALDINKNEVVREF